MSKDKVREQQVPMPAKYPIKITSEYTFIKYNPGYLVYSHIVYTLFHWVLGVGWFRLIGKHKIKGRENLKPLKGKGFITVANHCHIFDTVLTGVAVLPRRPWFASVQRNFEAAYFRKMFRSLRGFPIPDGPLGLRRILKPVTEAIHKGKIVHLFPEEELWHRYTGIDYFQRGAFYLAHQANCPIVPMVHLFKTRTFFGRKLSDEVLDITTIIGPAIYPDNPVTDSNGTDMQSIQKMTDQAQKWMKDIAAEYYGTDNM